MIKVIKYLGTIILILFSCSIIGQELKARREGKQQIILEEIITFEGAENTEENPWKITAGYFDMEEIGEAIFLTPNTSVIINEKTDNMELECQIHPWVRENSDGAGINLQYIDREEKIIHEEEWFIDNTETWEKITIDLNMYSNLEKIKLSCNNGDNNDSSADWVIIKQVTDAEYLDDNMIEISDFTTINNGEYVRSATYFADEWPINFWNSERDNLEKDLKQIKNDGFNSIIIVVPWREFQPEFQPVKYNEYAFTALEEIMEKAKETGLGVYLRLGYTWDYYNDDEGHVLDRFYKLAGDNRVKNAWEKYLYEVYNCVKKYESYRGAFLTWEDFWNILDLCNEETAEKRLDSAKLLKYQQWISSNFELGEYNDKFGTNYLSYEEIPIPRKSEPAMESMYAFYDYFLNNMLKKSQEIVPNLSMEVRIDWDPYYRLDGTQDNYKHNETFECGNSNYTSVMYGIPMGFENIGERVSYTEAMDKTKYILKNLRKSNGGKAVYIEQFIFADNTIGFEHNAQIKEEELNLYLENVYDVLLDNSEGYGIWTYRNYCSNMIYNSQFALMEEGWDSSQNVVFEELNDSNICRLSEGEWIQQKIVNTRIISDADEYEFELSVAQVDETSEISVSFGDKEEIITINDTGEYKIKLNKGTEQDLIIKNIKGNVSIDNIKLYTQVQQGFLYDENNNKLQCIESLRKLNSQLLENFNRSR